MEISGERDSRGSRVAMHRTCTDRRYHVELSLRRDTFSFISFRFTALYIRHDTRFVTPRSARGLFSSFFLSLLIPALLSAVCALSSVVFIVYDEWWMMKSPMTRFTQTHRVRPGRLAARLRVNVLLVISGLATSPLLVPPPSFLDLLPEPSLPYTSSAPRPHPPRSLKHRTRSASRHRPCEQESSRGSRRVQCLRH